MSHPPWPTLVCDWTSCSFRFYLSSKEWGAFPKNVSLTKTAKEKPKKTHFKQKTHKKIGNMQEQTSVLGFFVGGTKSCKLVAKKVRFFLVHFGGFRWRVGWHQGGWTNRSSCNSMGLVGTNCRELCFASTQLIRQEGGGNFWGKKPCPGWRWIQDFLKRHFF